eukprot:ANDGO_04363.mRNA.1 hypothetical protein
MTREKQILWVVLISDVDVQQQFAVQLSDLRSHFLHFQPNSSNFENYIASLIQSKYPEFPSSFSMKLQDHKRVDQMSVSQIRATFLNFHEIAGSGAAIAQKVVYCIAPGLPEDLHLHYQFQWYFSTDPLVNGQNFEAPSDGSDPIPSIVAEFIDNSIEACVKCKDDKKHTVSMHLVADKHMMWSHLFILDDGKGMSEESLHDAVTYARHVAEDASLSQNMDVPMHPFHISGELGKFGLGLKDAAFSMGRKVRIFSRTAHDEPGFIRMAALIDKDVKGYSDDARLRGGSFFMTDSFSFCQYAKAWDMEEDEKSLVCDNVLRTHFTTVAAGHGSCIMISKLREDSALFAPSIGHVLSEKNVEFRFSHFCAVADEYAAAFSSLYKYYVLGKNSGFLQFLVSQAGQDFLGKGGLQPIEIEVSFSFPALEELFEAVHMEMEDDERILLQRHKGNSRNSPAADADYWTRCARCSTLLSQTTEYVLPEERHSLIRIVSILGQYFTFRYFPLIEGSETRPDYVRLMGLQDKPDLVIGEYWCGRLLEDTSLGRSIIAIFPSLRQLANRIVVEVFFGRSIKPSSHKKMLQRPFDLLSAPEQTNRCRKILSDWVNTCHRTFDEEYVLNGRVNEAKLHPRRFQEWQILNKVAQFTACRIPEKIVASHNLTQVSRGDIFLLPNVNYRLSLLPVQIWTIWEHFDTIESVPNENFGSEEKPYCTTDRNLMVDFTLYGVEGALKDVSFHMRLIAFIKKKAVSVSKRCPSLLDAVAKLNFLLSFSEGRKISFVNEQRVRTAGVPFSVQGEVTVEKETFFTPLQRVFQNSAFHTHFFLSTAQLHDVRSNSADLYVHESEASATCVCRYRVAGDKEFASRLQSDGTFCVNLPAGIRQSGSFATFLDVMWNGTVLFTSTPKSGIELDVMPGDAASVELQWGDMTSPQSFAYPRRRETRANECISLQLDSRFSCKMKILDEFDNELTHLEYSEPTAMNVPRDVQVEAKCECTGGGEVFSMVVRGLLPEKRGPLPIQIQLLPHHLPSFWLPVVVLAGEFAGLDALDPDPLEKLVGRQVVSTLDFHPVDAYGNIVKQIDALSSRTWTVYVKPKRETSKKGVFSSIAKSTFKSKEGILRLSLGSPYSCEWGDIELSVVDSECGTVFSRPYTVQVSKDPSTFDIYQNSTAILEKDGVFLCGIRSGDAFPEFDFVLRNETGEILSKNLCSFYSVNLRVDARVSSIRAHENGAFARELLAIFSGFDWIQQSEHGPVLWNFHNQSALSVLIRVVRDQNNDDLVEKTVRFCLHGGPAAQLVLYPFGGSSHLQAAIKKDFRCDVRFVDAAGNDTTISRQTAETLLVDPKICCRQHIQGAPPPDLLHPSVVSLPAKVEFPNADSLSFVTLKVPGSAFSFWDDDLDRRAVSIGLVDVVFSYVCKTGKIDGRVALMHLSPGDPYCMIVENRTEIESPVYWSHDLIRRIVFSVRDNDLNLVSLDHDGICKFLETQISDAGFPYLELMAFGSGSALLFGKTVFSSRQETGRRAIGELRRTSRSFAWKYENERFLLEDIPIMNATGKTLCRDARRSKKGDDCLWIQTPSKMLQFPYPLYITVRPNPHPLQVTEVKVQNAKVRNQAPEVVQFEVFVGFAGRSDDMPTNIMLSEDEKTALVSSIRVSIVENGAPGTRLDLSVDLTASTFFLDNDDDWSAILPVSMRLPEYVLQKQNAEFQCEFVDQRTPFRFFNQDSSYEFWPTFQGLTDQFSLLRSRFVVHMDVQDLFAQQLSAPMSLSQVSSLPSSTGGSSHTKSAPETQEDGTQPSLHNIRLGTLFSASCSQEVELCLCLYIKRFAGDFLSQPVDMFFENLLHFVDRSEDYFIPTHTQLAALPVRPTFWRASDFVFPDLSNVSERDARAVLALIHRCFPVLAISSDLPQILKKLVGMLLGNVVICATAADSELFCSSYLMLHQQPRCPRCPVVLCLGRPESNRLRLRVVFESGFRLEFFLKASDQPTRFLRVEEPILSESSQSAACSPPAKRPRLA